MSSKTRTKSVSAGELDDSVWNLKTIAWLVLILVSLCLLLFAATKIGLSRLNAIPAEFEGTIVEKNVASRETEEGSSPYYRLTVEIEAGQRLTVGVTRQIYEEAQVGMRLKRSGRGLEVIPGAPR